MDCSLPGLSVHGIFQAPILSGLPFSYPGDLPDPGIELASPALSPALAGGFFTPEPPGLPTYYSRLAAEGAWLEHVLLR